MVKKLYRLENLFLFLVGLILFHNFSDNWVLFLIFFLAPDISMAGYFLNKRVGAIIYNLIHNYILAILLIVLGMVFRQESFLFFGSLLVCHVGLDRLFGFGLKYETDFKKTHIQKL